jgi:hypothetical protein
MRIFDRVSTLLFATTLALLAPACTRPAPAPEAPDARYLVRAEIARLPAAPGGDLYLRHEAIPDFIDSQGRATGMMSMTMPFAVEPGLDLAGFAAGDRVEVDFEVRWKASRQPLLVTRLERLPAGTRLEFDPEEEAEPDADADEETPPADSGHGDHGAAQGDGSDASGTPR